MTFAKTAPKSLFGFALLAACLPAMADVHIHGCEYEVKADVSLEGDSLRLTDKRKIEWRMEGGKLFRNGEQEKLSESESAQLRDYQAQMTALVPLASEVAVEGAAIGIEAAASAFTMLAGEGKPAKVAAMRKRLDAIHARLAKRFNGKHLYARGTGDSELDAEIEDAAGDMAGSMVGGAFSLVKVALFDHEEMEARADKLEKEIETRVEARADALDKKAQRLCPMLERADQLEDGLDRFNTIRLERDSK